MNFPAKIVQVIRQNVHCVTRKKLKIILYWTILLKRVKINAIPDTLLTIEASAVNVIQVARHAV